ncbi:MAG: ECF transporter S component [Lachnospiraceae bacterium]|nr:ECF transporter S component [Lachnospiraceae bacterium]
MEKKVFSTKQFVELALLVAIILLMAFTPIGYIKTFGLEITLIVVPVAVGAVTMGPLAGAILGGVFGLTSFIQCFGMSAFGTVLLGINPIYTFIVCFVSRVLMGWLTGVIYQGLKKIQPIRKVSVVIANLIGPLLNTLFFMGTLVLFFYNTEYIQGLAESMGASGALAFVVAFVGINGVIEALVCFVVGSAISKALQVVLKSN